MSREGPDLAAIDDDQSAVAVILDLVNPVSPRWWFQDRGRNFELDEAERGHIRLFVAGCARIWKEGCRAFGGRAALSRPGVRWRVLSGASDYISKVGASTSAKSRGSAVPV